MSLPDHDRDVFVDKIEPFFGSRLVLNLREQAGVVIGYSYISDSFIALIYSLVAMILVDHPINNNGLSRLFRIFEKQLRRS